MKASSCIFLGIAILSLGIPLKTQAQGFRIRTSSYPGIHGSIIVPQSENRGYNVRETNNYRQGNNYYSRERIIIERERGVNCGNCSYPSRSYPHEYNQGTREYYSPNRLNYNNYYSR